MTLSPLGLGRALSQTLLEAISVAVLPLHHAFIWGTMLDCRLVHLNAPTVEYKQPISYGSFIALSQIPRKRRWDSQTPQ